MPNNNDELKSLSNEEIDKLIKNTIEFGDSEQIAGNNWSVACSCLSSAWNYVSPVK